MSEKCFKKCIYKPGAQLDNSEQVRLKSIPYSSYNYSAMPKKYTVTSATKLFSVNKLLNVLLGFKHNLTTCRGVARIFQTGVTLCDT